jgi:ketosteroid isomerase-like protein
MGAQENLKLIKDAYAAFGRGDISAVLAAMNDDVEWTVPGQGLPLSGTYRGRNEVAGFFQKLAAEVEIQRFEPHAFIAQDDLVVVLGSERSRVKATNRIVEVGWAMVYTIRVSKFVEYTDTQALAAASATSAKAAS